MSGPDVTRSAVLFVHQCVDYVLTLRPPQLEVAAVSEQSMLGAANSLNAARVSAAGAVMEQIYKQFLYIRGSWSSQQPDTEPTLPTVSNQPEFQPQTGSKSTFHSCPQLG